MTSSVNMREIDEDGDVILIVTPRQPIKFEQGKIEKVPAVHFKASSEHLMLASKYFKKRLSSSWSEGETLMKQRSVQLNIPDTDPDAFEVILDLIHCRTNYVPREISLPLLTEVTIIADYFDCRDALGLFPETWIGSLKKNIPTSYCSDVIKWIFISSVFYDSQIFASVTRIAEYQGSNNMDIQKLPIPASIADSINQARNTALGEIFRALEKRRQQLSGSLVLCSYDCDAAKLGSIFKEMKANRLPVDSATPPFPGLSVMGVINCISKFKKLESCEKCRPYASYYAKSSHSPYSPIDEKTQNSIQASASKLKGLVLPKPSTPSPMKRQKT